MAIEFIVADRIKTQTIDLTATPQAVATSSSTYTIASLVAAVTAEEISGNGYARPTLSVASNTLNADGVGVLTYGTFSFTASGGNITYDRIALIADSDWVGWLNTGSTTILDGQSKSYQIVYGRGSTGARLTGADGRNAYTVSTANFTQPAAAANVSITVENSSWLAAGAIFYFTDGTNSGHYQVVSIDSATAITATNLDYTGDATAATTMLSGGSLVAAGRDGADGANGTDGLGWTGGSYDAGTGVATFTSTDGLGFATGDLRGATGATGADGITGFGLRFTYSATTTGPAGAGELRFNNASPGSATEIYIDAEDRNALDVSAISSALNVGSSILVLDESDAAVWALFTLNSVTDNGTDLTLGVTAVGAAGTFAGDVSLAFANKGDTGATGSTGAAGLDGADGLTGFGLRFTYSATTTGPAGSGELRFNNASPGSATNIFIDAEDRNALDVSGITSALNAGSSILVLDESDPAVWALFTLSSVTDNGTDLTLVVTAVGANGTFAGDVSLTFANKGDVGATGATGATGSVSAASTLTFTETTDPATPSAGDLVLWASSTDSEPYWKDDAGTKKGFQEKQLIAFTELTGTAASVTFSSIPQRFKNLELYFYARSNLAATGEAVLISYNSDTLAANYDYHFILNKSTTVSAGTSASSRQICSVPGSTSSANYFGSVSIEIPSYSFSTGFKMGISKYEYMNGTELTFVQLKSYWKSTSAITSITLSLGSGSFIAGSNFYLYGI